MIIETSPNKDNSKKPINLEKKAIVFTHDAIAIFPRTDGQRKIVDAIEHNDIIFLLGVAGTGKTFLSIAMAIAALKKQKIRHIVLSRPAVEAGERLGFLPGTSDEKLFPYLRPLYDALKILCERSQLKTYLNEGTIELAPLAYMRGRTLEQSFIILDEAQNASYLQMKMLLTRMGIRSKIIITADPSQVDLSNTSTSCLPQIPFILAGIPKITFVELTTKDVVRHALMPKIIKAYKKFEKDTQTKSNKIPSSYK